MLDQDPEDDEYDLVYEFYQYDEGNHSDIHSDCKHWRLSSFR